MAAGLDKSNGNLSVVVIFTSACFYNYINYTLGKNLEFYDIMYVNRTFLYLDI